MAEGQLVVAPTMASDAEISKQGISTTIGRVAVGNLKLEIGQLRSGIIESLADRYRTNF